MSSQTSMMKDWKPNHNDASADSVLTTEFLEEYEKILLGMEPIFFL